MPSYRQQDPSARNMPFFGYMFLVFLLFFISLDSIWSYRIPKGSYIRLLIPFILLLIYVIYSKGKHQCTLNTHITCFVVVGLISTLQGNSIILGGSKLILYIAVLIPLCRFMLLHDSFLPHTRGLDLLILMTSGLLLLNIPMLRKGPGGIFDNPNQLGIFTLCALPMMLYKYDTSRSGRDRLWGAAMVALSLLLSVWSRSRGGTFANVITMTTYLSLRKSDKISKIIVTVMILAAVGVLILTFDDAIYQEVLGFVYKDNSAAMLDDARTKMMGNTFKFFAERPLFGYGFGLSWMITPEVVQTVLTYGRLSWFSGEFGNSTLAMLSGGGLMLVLVFYSIFGTILLQAIRGLRRCQRGSAEYIYIASLTSGYIGMLANSQAEAWMMSPVTWASIFFWFYSGLLMNSSVKAATDSFYSAQSCRLYLRKILSRELRLTS